MSVQDCPLGHRGPDTDDPLLPYVHTPCGLVVHRQCMGSGVCCICHRPCGVDASTSPLHPAHRPDTSRREGDTVSVSPIEDAVSRSVPASVPVCSPTPLSPPLSPLTRPSELTLHPSHTTPQPEDRPASTAGPTPMQSEDTVGTTTPAPLAKVTMYTPEPDTGRELEGDRCLSLAPPVTPTPPPSAPSGMTLPLTLASSAPLVLPHPTLQSEGGVSLPSRMTRAVWRVVSTPLAHIVSVCLAVVAFCVTAGAGWVLLIWAVFSPEEHTLLNLEDPWGLVIDGSLLLGGLAAYCTHGLVLTACVGERQHREWDMADILARLWVRVRGIGSGAARSTDTADTVRMGSVNQAGLYGHNPTHTLSPSPLSVCLQFPLILVIAFCPAVLIGCVVQRYVSAPGDTWVSMCVTVVVLTLVFWYLLALVSPVPCRERPTADGDQRSTSSTSSASSASMSPAKVDQTSSGGVAQECDVVPSCSGDAHAGETEDEPLYDAYTDIAELGVGGTHREREAAETEGQSDERESLEASCPAPSPTDALTDGDDTDARTPIGAAGRDTPSPSTFTRVLSALWMTLEYIYALCMSLAAAGKGFVYGALISLGVFITIFALAGGFGVHLEENDLALCCFCGVCGLLTAIDHFYYAWVSCDSNRAPRHLLPLCIRWVWRVLRGVRSHPHPVDTAAVRLPTTDGHRPPGHSTDPRPDPDDTITASSSGVPALIGTFPPPHRSISRLIVIQHLTRSPCRVIFAMMCLAAATKILFVPVLYLVIYVSEGRLYAAFVQMLAWGIDIVLGVIAAVCGYVYYPSLIPTHRWGCDTRQQREGQRVGVECLNDPSSGAHGAESPVSSTVSGTSPTHAMVETSVAAEPDSTLPSPPISLDRCRGRIIFATLITVLCIVYRAVLSHIPLEYRVWGTILPRLCYSVVALAVAAVLPVAVIWSLSRRLRSHNATSSDQVAAQEACTAVESASANMCSVGTDHAPETESDVVSPEVTDIHPCVLAPTSGPAPPALLSPLPSTHTTTSEGGHQCPSGTVPLYDSLTDTLSITPIHTERETVSVRDSEPYPVSDTPDDSAELGVDGIQREREAVETEGASDERESLEAPSPPHPSTTDADADTDARTLNGAATPSRSTVRRILSAVWTALKFSVALCVSLTAAGCGLMCGGLLTLVGMGILSIVAYRVVGVDVDSDTMILCALCGGVLTAIDLFCFVLLSSIRNRPPRHILPLCIRWVWTLLTGVCFRDITVAIQCLMGFLCRVLFAAMCLVATSVILFVPVLNLVLYVFEGRLYAAFIQMLAWGIDIVLGVIAAVCGYVYYPRIVPVIGRVFSFLASAVRLLVVGVPVMLYRCVVFVGRHWRVVLWVTLCVPCSVLVLRIPTMPLQATYITQ
ncbi:hypothetical protein KIPB_005999 [Kipferlia bialata]|uniref:Uncharacterized protein n=1 Tax=Kipferlia bialata TaxID=797122 RepID=A0A9K3CY05_9EUKA|nr:hypothetical protein KIPB_005999 [Kipferlia bialata]|eukprot:g5999.t1